LKNSQEEYIGMMMPCYEFEYDMGVYGFIGNNGMRLSVVKKIENSFQESSSELKLKAV
jgi:hypothetical protein